MTRADAVRNRERVVAAAREVFTEHGLDAGVDLVATRAGVGKATVYRSFPTKEHLVSAISCGEIDAWVQRLRTAPGDAWTVLRDVLADAAEQKAAKVLAGLAGVAVEVPELVQARARWHDAVTALLQRGAGEGTVRADATADEVVVLFGGACRVLTARGEADPVVWRRHAELVAAGFRP